MRFSIFIAMACLGGSGCNETLPPPDAGPGSLVALRIEPADVTLVISDATAVVQDYRAIGSFADGTERDVTALARFDLAADQDIGAFDGATFTSSTEVGGNGRVEAFIDALTAETSITVTLRRRISPPTTGEPLPESPEALFAGTEDPLRAPELVYPSDGVVLPPNLGRIELHFLRGDVRNTLFELAFENAVTDVRAYARCTPLPEHRDDGCVVEVRDQVWDWIARSNVGGAPLEVSVAAADESGDSFGRSEPIEIQFPLDDLTGALYYWTTSDNTQIMRYDFGARPGRAEPVMGPAQTDTGRCVGCHALSRDGTKIVASVGGQLAGGLLLFDLTNSVPLRNETAEEDHILQFASFRPDGNELVGVFGDDTSSPNFGDLVLFDTRCDASSMDTCGLETGRISLGGAEASHPDWAADGTRIAYTDVGVHYTSQRFREGAIAYVERQGSGWSAPTTLMPRLASHNRFNPHYAADSSFLVFNESVCAPNDALGYDCNADSDPNATIYALPRDGGTPIRLSRAQQPGPFDDAAALSNTYPRFAPSVFVLNRTDGGPRRLMWLTFSSSRRVGVRTPGPSLSSETTTGRWLWITAIDPDALARGEDPSFPAFALPFQDFSTSNHIAVWTTRTASSPGG